MKNTFLTPTALSLINQTAFPHGRLAPPDVRHHFPTAPGRGRVPPSQSVEQSSVIQSEKQKMAKGAKPEKPTVSHGKVICFVFFFVVFVSDEDKRVKKTRDRFENPRKASTTEQNWLLNTTFTETKGLLGTKKAYYYVQS